MSKLDQLRRDAGSNVGESMGGGRSVMGAIPRVSGNGPPPKPAHLLGVSRNLNTSEIEVDRIVADPDQPREEFEDEALERLAESMRTRGQLQPIRVWWNAEQSAYTIIMGERRWRAAMRAGIKSLTCVVADKPDTASDLLSLQLIENCLREDLSDTEQAKAFRTLMDANGWSTHQLAKELGIAQPNVVRAVSILKLSEPVQARIESGELTASAAYHVSKIDDPEEQAKVVERIVSEGLKRDEVVEVVRQVKAQEIPKQGRPKAEGKVRGAKSKAKAAPVKVREFKTRHGIRITAERGRGLDLLNLIEGLEDFAHRLKQEAGYDPPPDAPGHPEIDPTRIQWGSVIKESIPADEVAAARNAIEADEDYQLPNVAYDGSNYWLIDGGAILSAALSLRLTKIPVATHMGGQKDARRLAGKWAAEPQGQSPG